MPLPETDQQSHTLTSLGPVRNRARPEGVGYGGVIPASLEPGAPRPKRTWGPPKRLPDWALTKRAAKSAAIPAPAVDPTLAARSPLSAWIPDAHAASLRTPLGQSSADTAATDSQPSCRQTRHTQLPILAPYSPGRVRHVPIDREDWDKVNDHVDTLEE